jgi:hypothetical protein
MNKYIKAVIDWLKYSPPLPKEYLDPTFKLHDETGAVVWQGTAALMLTLVRFEEMHREVAQDYAELQATILDEGDAKVDLLQRIDKLEAQNTLMGNALFDIMKLETETSSFAEKTMVAIAKSAAFS